MARKQTRRSISVKGTTYQRIKYYVESHGGSIANFVEEVVRGQLGDPTDEDCKKFGEEVEKREKESEARKAEEKEDELAGYVDPITFF